MEIKRLSSDHKTVNNPNQNFMKGIFTPKLYPKVRPNGILVKHHNTVICRVKRLKTLGPKIWSQLPGDIKL